MYQYYLLYPLVHTGGHVQNLHVVYIYMNELVNETALMFTQLLNKIAFILDAVHTYVLMYQKVCPKLLIDSKIESQVPMLTQQVPSYNHHNTKKYAHC